jgi:hypothetical protein
VDASRQNTTKSDSGSESMSPGNGEHPSQSEHYLKRSRSFPIAQSIESAMKSGTTVGVRQACAEFLETASEFYKVPACGIRVLASRPLRVRENWSTELFGDYTPETMLIRVWMKTAVRKEVMSFRNIPEHSLPRVLLPPSGFPAVRIFGLVAYSRFL